MDKHLNHNQFTPPSLFFILLLASFIFIGGCNDDSDDEGPSGSDETLLEIAQSRDNLSRFIAAVSAFEDLSSTLNDESQSLTVFVPSNNAFDTFLSAFGYGSIGDVPEDTLKQVLEFHVVSNNAVSSGDMADGQILETLLSGESVVISIDGDTYMVESSEILNADVVGSNGVIHVIDAVLLPGFLQSTVEDGTALDIVQGSGQLSVFEEALSGFPSLVELLDDENESITVFAPSNAAFGSAIGALGYGSLEEVPDDTLMDILQYHITTESGYSSGDLTNGQSIATLSEGNSLSVSKTGGSVQINTSTVISADLMATNGYVHVIDVVLLPFTLSGADGSVLDLAASNEDLSVFVQAIAKFPDLQAQLDAATGDFTIFAPNNDGFQRLLNITRQDTIGDIPNDILRRFLEYHIAPETILSSGLGDRESIATLLPGDEIPVRPDTENGGYLLDRSEIISADGQAENGILHIITGILFPRLEARCVNTILEPIYFNKNYSIFIEAIERTEYFESFLDKSEDYTLFAPSNSAFSEAGINSLDDIGAEELKAVMDNHINQQMVYLEADLLSAGTINTEGGSLTITSSGAGTVLNGETVITTADIQNDNGATHLIDQVITE